MLSGGRCAVVGDQVAHSLSPAMHRAAYARLGLTHTYDAIGVEPGGLEAFVSGLDASWIGLSVTAPHKRDALDLADFADDVARRVGAANTLVLDGGSVAAHNTDVPGAMAALREAGVEQVRSVRVLGGGATAASLAAAVAGLGARRLELVVREPSRARAAREAGERCGVEVTTASLSDPPSGPVDLLVSTVPAAAVLERAPSLVASASAVFDVVYDPWPTPLAAAVTGDTPLVTGLDLLVHQAVLQVQLMTGAAVGADVLRSAALGELERR
ncbi:shikimate dehydrogenase [Aeromicrobium sp. CF4.19]|uniref:shikimate dehydrogenase n=1 Tax=Aeromicrobium sp. CF4.19 TaxID=3373082 RepID=UPI003EE75FD8